MDTCKKCSQKFKYWEIYKNYWSAKQELHCSSCEASHVYSLKSRVVSSIFVLFIPGVIQTAIQALEKPERLNIYTILLLYIGMSFLMSFLTNPLLKFKLTKTKNS
jgi:CXXC-20-CXXC protein